MNNVTAYLENMIDSAYDPSFVQDRDDVINAENTVECILRTTYANADYGHLKAYAQTARDRLYDEIGF